MKICVVGAGNVGLALALELTLRGNQVSLLTSKPDLWNTHLILENKDFNESNRIKIKKVTSNVEEAVKDNDIILLTVPSNAYELYITKLLPYIKEGMLIGAIPGTGGYEFYRDEIIGKGASIFGLQRVPAVYRVKGNVATISGKREFLDVSGFPTSKLATICNMVQKIFAMPCRKWDNYLNITLTPSNPILHTSRLYCLFSQQEEWSYKPKFYQDWDLKSSELLLACDRELQGLIDILKSNGISLKGYRSLKEHYESETPQKLMDKIRSIKSFENLLVPMVEKQGKYYADYTSRYFKEDFTYGLYIIRDFCNILEIDTPTINKILDWFETLPVENDNQRILPSFNQIENINDIKQFYGR